MSDPVPTQRIRGLCDQISDLMEASLPTAGVQRLSDAPGASTEPRLPLHHDTIDTRASLKLILVSWALLIVEERDIDYDSADNVTAIAAWIYQQADWLAAHPAYDDFITEVETEVAELSRLEGQVTITHAFALSSNPAPEVERIVELLAEAGISLTTVAPQNGVLPQRSLREHRVALGLGEDGQRDYWSPYGDGDLMRRTWQLAFTNGLRRDEGIEACLDIASRGRAQVIAGARPGEAALVDDARFGLGIGAPADFMLVDADTVTSAIMDCPADRDVFKDGRLVATGGNLVDGEL